MDPSGFPSTLRKDVFEPETPALQGQCSTAELRAQRFLIINENGKVKIGGDPAAGSPTATL